VREIKFRCWDKKKKEWVGAECGGVMDLNYSGSYNCFMFDNDNFDIPKDVIWCQFTGLRDRHGKEIFEGDILKTSDGTLCYLEYCEAAYELITISHDNYYCRLYAAHPEIEVIGNIYENEDLLP